jgi:hypothetical protein
MEEACNRLGADLLRNKTSFETYFNGACDHAIHVRGSNAYEAGLRALPGGDGYNLAYDDYGQRGQALERALGVGLVGLQNEYLAVVTERFCRSQGRMVQRVDEGGEIVLRAYA